MATMTLTEVAQTEIAQTKSIADAPDPCIPSWVRTSGMPLGSAPKVAIPWFARLPLPCCDPFDKRNLVKLQAESKKDPLAGFLACPMDDRANYYTTYRESNRASEFRLGVMA